ncbi:MAG: cyclic-di-AMP receptor [Anaerolineae bacterium]|nr:cyclic-di-AMP receptor [Anaerolineae bacterium]
MKKMIMVVIPRDQANPVLESLITAGYSMTFAESRGGVWRQAQYTLHTCVDEAQVDDVMDIIRENCRTRVEVTTEGVSTQTMAPGQTPFTANLGDAVVFVWDVNRMEIF